MLKALYAVISLFISIQPLVAATVRLNDVNTPVVQVTRPTLPSTLSLVVDSPSGDGTSKSAPAKVYVPISATGGTNNTNYSTYDTSPTTLPATDDGLGSLIFRLDLNENAEAVDFYVGVEETDGNFSIVDNVSLAPTQGNDIDVTVELNDICNADSNGSDVLDCTSKFLEADDPVSQKSVILYLFYGNVGLTGSGNDLAANTTGIYYELKLSNKISTSTITFARLDKSDGQLIAFYTGPTLTDFYQINAYDFAVAGGGSVDFGSKGAGTNYILTSTATSGEAKIKGLINDQVYNFSLYFTDKYKFATLLSNDLTQTPQNIEALLEKNACFLLTAGFGGDHPIIDYFRIWRDEFLLSFGLGKIVVDFYYDWGPKLAPYILESPYLAKVVRGGAYAAYWTLELRLWAVLVFFILALVLLKRRNRLN